MAVAARPPTAYLLHAVQERAAVDVAVDELVVKLDGLTRNLGCLRFHG